MTLSSFELRNRFPDISVRYQNDVDLVRFWSNLSITERRRLNQSWARHRPGNIRNNTRQSQRHNPMRRPVVENHAHIQGEVSFRLFQIISSLFLALLILSNLEPDLCFEANLLRQKLSKMVQLKKYYLALFWRFYF